MLVRVDTAVVAVESEAVGEVARAVAGAVNVVSVSLSGCAGMAGIDPMGEEFVSGTPETGGYDASVSAVLRSAAGVGNMVCALQGHLLGLAVGYRAVENVGAGVAENPYQVMRPVSLPPVAQVPGSALGEQHLDTPGGELLDWVEHFLKDTAGIVVPTADTGKVRAAGVAWGVFGSDLSAAKSKLSAALPVTGVMEFPQKGDLFAVVGRVEQVIGDLVTNAESLGFMCESFAESVDKVRGELVAALGQLVAELAVDVGLGVVLSSLTAGLGSAAVVAKMTVTVARWVPRLKGILDRLRVLIVSSKRSMVIVREAVDGALTGAVANAVVSPFFGTFSFSGVGAAGLSSLVGAGVSAPFAGVGAGLKSKPVRGVVRGVVGAGSGAVGGVAGDWAASGVFGQDFSVGQSLLFGAVGGLVPGVGGRSAGGHAVSSSGSSAVDVPTVSSSASAGSSGLSASLGSLSVVSDMPTTGSPSSSSASVSVSGEARSTSRSGATEDREIQRG